MDAIAPIEVKVISDMKISPWQEATLVRMEKS